MGLLSGVSSDLRGAVSAPHGAIRRTCLGSGADCRNRFAGARVRGETLEAPDEPSEGSELSTRGTAPGRLATWLAAGLALHGTLVGLSRGPWQPDPHPGLLERWLWTALGQPFRTSLGILLVSWALWPRAQPPPGPRRTALDPRKTLSPSLYSSPGRGPQSRGLKCYSGIRTAPSDPLMSGDSDPFVHGPLKSPRVGKALAIDLTAPQSHLVVQRGSSLARGSVIVTTAARRLIEMSKAGDKLNSIAVVGSGTDPAEHPDLREVTENLRVLRNKWFPRAKLCIFTAAKDLESYDQRASLAMYDKLFLQYEWGTAKTFATATGEKSVQLGVLTRQLQGFDHLIVQANFFRGDMDNSTATEVTSWIKKLQEVRPQEVHILTGPGSQPRNVRPITRTRRLQIAEQVAETTGIAVSIHEDETLLV